MNVSINGFEADKYLDEIFVSALERRASDVHLEPHGDGCRILFRVDGLLELRDLIPLENSQKVVSRLKVLSGLPVYERDLAQDGQIEIQDGEVPLQARVSVLPTIHGEKAVVRIFHRDDCALDLENLGLGKEVVASLRKFQRERQGVLLFTGPSGSGKTTTIYALLEEIHRTTRGETNIATLEDPVERDLGFAAQTPFSKCRNLNYSKALASLLRQDPEVIMVGEIRDPETAQIAIRAGLTGHLVVSAIHSRDTAEVFLRLLEMGIESYLVASAVVGVIAQRLLRRLCDACKRETVFPEEDRLLFGVAPEVPIFSSSGCDDCQSVGYRGRTAIAESLAMTDALREVVLARTDLNGLRKAARGSLAISLTESAGRLLSQGVTSPEEVYRVLPGLGREYLHAVL